MQTTTEQPHQTVAGEVRAALARRRVSGRQAAREIGWTPAYIGRRLSGDTPFDVNDLVALAALLDVPVTTFFGPLNAGYAPSTGGVISGSVKSSYLWPVAA